MKYFLIELSKNKKFYVKSTSLELLKKELLELQFAPLSELTFTDISSEVIFGMKYPSMHTFVSTTEKLSSLMAKNDTYTRFENSSTPFTTKRTYSIGDKVILPHSIVKKELTVIDTSTKGSVVFVKDVSLPHSYQAVYLSSSLIKSTETNRDSIILNDAHKPAKPFRKDFTTINQLLISLAVLSVDNPLSADETMDDRVSKLMSKSDSILSTVFTRSCPEINEISFDGNQIALGEEELLIIQLFSANIIIYRNTFFSDLCIADQKFFLNRQVKVTYTSTPVKKDEESFLTAGAAIEYMKKNLYHQVLCDDNLYHITEKGELLLQTDAKDIELEEDAVYRLELYLPTTFSSCIVNKSMAD